MFIKIQLINLDKKLQKRNSTTGNFIMINGIFRINNLPKMNFYRVYSKITTTFSCLFLFN